jgi:hypothetical protein
MTPVSLFDTSSQSGCNSSDGTPKSRTVSSVFEDGADHAGRKRQEIIGRPTATGGGNVHKNQLDLLRFQESGDCADLLRTPNEEGTDHLRSRAAKVSVNVEPFASATSERVALAVTGLALRRGKS